jgi:ABC-type bacteriocin/lantibiotic exporter with double-glycine peptidase domain
MSTCDLDELKRRDRSLALTLMLDGIAMYATLVIVAFYAGIFWLIALTSVVAVIGIYARFRSLSRAMKP